MKTYEYLALSALLLGSIAQAKSVDLKIKCQAREMKQGVYTTSEMEIALNTKDAALKGGPWDITVSLKNENPLVGANSICGATVTSRCQDRIHKSMGTIDGIHKSCGKSSIDNGSGKYYPEQEAKLALNSNLNHGFFHCQAIASDVRRHFELSSCSAVRR